MVKQAMAPVGGRHVRMLVAGSGAPALLLHGSPSNADSLLPLVERLQRDFLVIAPDTPGNGASEPLLPEAPQAERYADALAALLDVLKLPQVAVYGFHTGAVFAAELAGRHPTRVRAAVCDGLPLWTEAEAAQLDESYLAPLTPQRDGAHLAALWSRIIDQNWRFPWHLREAGQRLNRDLDDIDRLHSQALGLLYAGNPYRVPYAAALKADGQPRLQRLRTPTLVTAAKADVLSHHLSRVPPSQRVQVEHCEDAEQVASMTEDWFKRHEPAPAKLALPPAQRRFVDVGQGQLYVEGHADAGALWLHDAGESSAQAPKDEAALRLDLPGHGLSTAPWPKTAEEVRELLMQGIEAAGLDVRNCRLQGRGLGRQLANLLSGKGSGLAAQPMEIPDVAPRWDGAHLLAAWHFCRFHSQYQPWFRRGPGARLEAPLPSAAALQQKTLDVLCAGRETLARTLPYSHSAPRPDDVRSQPTRS